MNGAVGVAVEHAADAIFQLDDTLGRFLHQSPGEILIVEIRAAFDSVVEVALEGILGVENAVVAALYHSGAAALAEQALYDDHDAQPGVDLLRVHGGQQTGTAG